MTPFFVDLLVVWIALQLSEASLTNKTFVAKVCVALKSLTKGLLMSATQTYLRIGGKVHGPYSNGQIESGLVKDKIPALAEIAHAKHGPWEPIALFLARTRFSLISTAANISVMPPVIFAASHIKQPDFYSKHFDRLEVSVPHVMKVTIG